MAIPPPQEGRNVSTPIKRIRWATQRVTSVKGNKKRNGIINRFHKGPGAAEKKRESAGTDSLGESQIGAGPEDVMNSDEGREGVTGLRRLFFNIPLPDDAKDEDGHNLANFGRNKIKTAKYTPLTFIPYDLWLQFHNVANTYFLFLVILAVSASRTITFLLYSLTGPARSFPYLVPRIQG